MTAPIPEEQDQEPVGTTTPPGEHAGELPDAEDATGGRVQEENAETSLDQPSDGAGGQG